MEITYNFEALQNTKATKMHGNLIIDAETTIDYVRHKVVDRWVKCDKALNRRPWGVTPAHKKCSVCFQLEEKPKQLTLF